MYPAAIPPYSGLLFCLRPTGLQTARVLMPGAGQQCVGTGKVSTLYIRPSAGGRLTTSTKSNARVQPYVYVCLRENLT